MKKINIISIIGKYSPLAAANLQHNKPILKMNPKRLKAAIKEIVGAVIDKCAEEAILANESCESIQEGTIIAINNVENQIDYE